MKKILMVLTSHDSLGNWPRFQGTPPEVKS